MVDGLIPNKFPTAGGGGGADEDAFLLNVPEDVWESRRRPVGQSGDLPPPLSPLHPIHTPYDAFDKVTLIIHTSLPLSLALSPLSSSPLLQESFATTSQ